MSTLLSRAGRQVRIPHRVNGYKELKFVLIVFELLEPYTCLDATKDSSARHPPPRCHPETRLKIRERLTQWLLNENDKWKMLWVRGSAGTGKSAVAQSFGDSCGEAKRHGASYFFSRLLVETSRKLLCRQLLFSLRQPSPSIDL